MDELIIRELSSPFLKRAVEMAETYAPLLQQTAQGAAMKQATAIAAHTLDEFKRNNRDVVLQVAAAMAEIQVAFKPATLAWAPILYGYRANGDCAELAAADGANGRIRAED